jgi:2-oxoglutarate dehydrogenase E2 component (dihydrolipoamide succinyltransferase)
MAVEIRVPQLGESVVEATVARWLKQVGETVAPGDGVVELETEKVNVEVPADAGGVLAGIAHQEGDTVRIGDVLGTLDDAPGSTSRPGTGSAAIAQAPVEAGNAPAVAAPVSPAAPPGVPAAAGAGGSPAASMTSATSAPPLAPAAPAAQRDGISPVAQRIAVERGIDASRLEGSGPGGRVMKEDVLEYAQGPAAAAPDHGAAAAAPAPPTAPPPPPAGAPAPAIAPPPVPAAAPAVPLAAPAADGRGEERVRLSRRRLTIARRLVEAQHTAAMLTTFNEIDMSAVMDVRKRRRDAFRERHGVSLGFMSFFTKASIGALKAFPNVNAELQGEELILKRYYDVGVAVSTEEGLVVPVVRDADRKTFAEIEREIAALATRARERKLTLEELRGGTFTITNGGVFGSLLSTPILNPPQVGILGMHKIEERPVASNGQVVIRPMMYVALTYDHRIVDGREAVSFLVKVKELVEDPEALLLEG